MADTGWIYAGSGRNIDKGCTDWTNPGNVTGEGDFTYAQASLPGYAISDELNAYNYTMGVPAGKQIDGIYCALYKKGNYHSIKDYHLYLMDGTSHKGDNKADTDTWWIDSSPTWIYYGGITDLWGASWTAAQVNASTFGLIVRGENYISSPKSAYVDAVGIKIYYSDAPILANNHLMIMGM